MKLVTSEERFIVDCHTDNFGYISDDHYAFESKEDLESFLGINDNHMDKIYKYGTDIFGRQRRLGASEYPVNIYSKIEYKIDWEDNIEDD